MPAGCWLEWHSFFKSPRRCEACLLDLLIQPADGVSGSSTTLPRKRSEKCRTPGGCMQRSVSSLLLHTQLHQHLRVGGVFLQQGKYALNGLYRLVAGKPTAQEVDFLNLETLKQKLFPAGA